MPISDYFACTYAEAQDKFLAVALDSHAQLAAYRLPDLYGPRNEELSVDVAIHGPENPVAMLLLISATHGVEGFCGSGCQVGFFTDKLYDMLPPGTGTILVHALNPHGFAHLRRVNEDNIDLNRNFQDFSIPLPPSAAYEEIHDWLVPKDWDGPIRQQADEALQQYIKERGMPAFQSAVSGGQYTRPTGLFYGGTSESWSNLTLRRILKDHIPQTVKKLAVLDFHTGLGPTGYGEAIYPGSDSDIFERTKKWFGPEVTSTQEGSSTSASITGSVYDAFTDLASTVEITYLVLEYGTLPILEVLAALRADHWLHAVPDRSTPLREEIKRQIRNAFYLDTPAWKAAVYGRAVDFISRASRGLATA